MDDSTRAAYAQHRGVDKRAFRSACYAPFTSLYFNTNGDVIACCKNTSYVLGNIANERLEDIWRGKRAKALRKALAADNFKLGCEFCEWQVGAGSFDQVYAKTFDRLTVRDPEPEWPVQLEFTLSNTCNLACIMCYGELSSTIRSQRENLPPLPKVYDDRFFEDLRRFLPHLEVAKFFGGEPFLAQENFRVFDMMIADGITIPCHVTTNGTQWNKKVERVLEHLPVSLSISVDGATKATAESIRVNMDFDVVTQNVRRFLDYARGRKTYLSLTYCLMRQNWHEFGDYLRYGEDLAVDVFINTVVDPKDCSLYTLPPDELLRIVEHMREQDARHGYSRLTRNGARWKEAIATLDHNANERQRAGLGDARAATRQRAQQLRPDHVSRAWELVNSGQPAAAIEAVAHVRDDDPNAYDACIVRARAHRDLGQLGEADAVLGRAIALWRKAPTAYVERGWIRLLQGRLTEALAEGRTAQGLMSGAAGERIAPSVHHLLAETLRLFGDRTGALQHVDTLLARRSDAAFVQLRKDIEAIAGPATISRAWDLVHGGEFAAALDVLRAQPQETGAHIDAAVLEAHCLRRLGRNEDAERSVLASLSRCGETTSLLTELGWLRLDSGQTVAALEAGRRAEKLLAGLGDGAASAAVHHLLAETLHRLADHEGALRHVDALLRQRGDEAFVQLRRDILAASGAQPKS
jgi:radical SAM protein with 4Fe4S-binding SPASM domain